MINLLLKTSFFLMLIFMIVGIYFNYRVQYLMFSKVRPLLRQHGSKFMTGLLVVKYKRDLLLYEEICIKNKIKSDLPSTVKNLERKSWIFLVTSFLLLIAFLSLRQTITG